MARAPAQLYRRGSVQRLAQAGRAGQSAHLGWNARPLGFASRCGSPMPSWSNTCAGARLVMCPTDAGEARPCR